MRKTKIYDVRASLASTSENCDPFWPRSTIFSTIAFLRMNLSTSTTYISSRAGVATGQYFQSRSTQSTRQSRPPTSKDDSFLSGDHKFGFIQCAVTSWLVIGRIPNVASKSFVDTEVRPTDGGEDVELLLWRVVHPLDLIFLSLMMNR